MKKLLFLMCILLIHLGTDYYAQARRRNFDALDGPRKRIEELEKLKLLESLDLDEKTMLQFFSRRKDFNENLQKLENEKNEKLDQISDMIKRDVKDQEYKRVISDIINIEDRVRKAKEDYITSLDGLLTNEQIAKVLLFDRNFRKEIKEIILKHRKEKD